MDLVPTAPSTRVPPHDAHAEQAVLGAMIVSADAIGQAVELLQADDFYRLRHQVIFQAIVALADRSEPVDLLTVESELERTGKAEEAGGQTYLIDLFNGSPMVAHLGQYAKTVRRAAHLRKLIDLSHGIVAGAFDGEEPEALIAQAETALTAMGEVARKGGYRHIRDVVTETYALVEKIHADGRAVTGFASGLDDLDAMTTGFQPADLVILAGRPGMGKTALALTIALNGALRGDPVLLFSLEMAGQQLAMRGLAMEGRINQTLIRTGRLSEAAWGDLQRAAGALSDSELYVEDTCNVSLRQMRQRARRLKAEKGLGLIVVDYLQLMEVQEKRTENRQVEVSQLSRGLKLLARELSVPVLALSQLSRKCEERTDKRPMLSDLRESGAIEQDADIVLGIYRDCVYHEHSEDGPNVGEVIVLKQRNGPLGSLKLEFNPAVGRFRNMARERDDVGPADEPPPDVPEWFR